MTKLAVFTNKGTKTKEIEPSVVKTEVNEAVVAQALRVYFDHLHTGLSKVKTRGEVKISTRKIYRQKGTGNARHGAKSAPIFVGGGVAHGPKGLKRKTSLPKSLKDIALRSSLAATAKEKSLVLVEDLGSFKKTADVVKTVNKIKKDLNLNETGRVTFILPVGCKTFAFRNIKNSVVYNVDFLNAYKIVNGGLVLIDADAISFFEKVKKNIENKPQPKTTKTNKISSAKRVAKKTTTTKQVKGGKE